MKKSIWRYLITLSNIRGSKKFICRVITPPLPYENANVFTNNLHTFTTREDLTLEKYLHL